MNSTLDLAQQAASTNVAGQTEDETIAAESMAPDAENREGDTAPSPEAEPAPAKTEGQIRHKVLIVEDTTELAEVIAATLERINIQTLHETHVESALQVYKTENPDVILLDIGLPDQTGWKLMDAIKEREAHERPMVIVITAHGDPANRLMGKLQGVHSYLVKPFTPNEVEQVVGKALADKLTAGAPTDEKVTVTASLPEFIQKIIEGEIPESEEDMAEQQSGEDTAAP